MISVRILEYHGRDLQFRFISVVGYIVFLTISTNDRNLQKGVFFLQLKIFPVQFFEMVWKKLYKKEYFELL